MSKSTLLKVPLWKLALRFGLIFVFVVILIQLIWEFFSSGNLQAITKSIEDGYWVTYVISKVFIGVVYGFIMAYFTKRNAKK
jgi:hypothetical protein